MPATSLSTRFDQRNSSNTAYAESFVSGSNLIYGTNGFGVVTGLTIVPSSSYSITSSYAISSSYATSGSFSLTSSFSSTSSYVESDRYVFDTDLTVSLKAGKTFGRYLNGETIPSTGKTAAEVIGLAIVEPIPPTLTLTSPTTIAFNQTAISNSLSASYIINSLNGTVSSVSLEWRRGGVGSWTVLSTSTTNPLYFLHTLTDTNFNTSTFNYRYIVTDSISAQDSSSLNITPSSYSAPSITLNVVGNSITSPETNTKRERGNVSSTLSGTITRNSVNVALTSYTIQYQVNGGAWNNVPGATAVSISGPSASISAIVHNPTGDNTASTIAYRVQVVDAYTTTTSSTTTINFLYMIYYGPSSSTPLDSSGVRSLGNRIFTDGSNPYNLLTGTTEKIFTSAMPNSLSITEVLDLDALNANITANYILSTFNVNDAGGNAVSYKVYTMTNAIPYSDTSHRHQTTRS